MNLSKSKIEQYFRENDFVESLLLKLQFLEDANKLLIIVDFAKTEKLIDKFSSNQIEYDKDWRKIVFKEIWDYSRTVGTDTKKNSFLNDYSQKNQRGSKVIHFIEVNNFKSGLSCLIDFGDFGICKFKFKKAEIERKLGKAVKVGKNKWDYFDVTSKDDIDYYNPFFSGSL